MDGIGVLIWSLTALAMSLAGIKKASMKITLAGQLMGVIGVLWALSILIF